MRAAARTACGSAAAASAAGASTVTAITASRWPLRSPAWCAREPIEIDDVANVATSFPGFPALARAAGLALRSRHERDAPSRRPVVDHRRSERLGQGHGQPAAGAPHAAGICSTAARCTAWWRWRAARGLAPDDVAGHARSCARRMQVEFSSERRARSGCCSTGRDVTAAAADRGDRCRGLARGGLAGGARGAAGAPARLRRSPRAWSPTGATWAPWFSRAPRSRSS